jgi:hypothetical protein
VLVLADALRGKSRLKELRLQYYNDAGFSHVARALAENHGLKALFLENYFTLYDETNWSTMCDSLARHPTLERLGFGGNTTSRRPGEGVNAYYDRRANRFMEVARMLESNKVLIELTVYGHLFGSDKAVLSESVYPRLQLNRLLRAVKRSDSPLREHLIAWALCEFRNMPNGIWMLLSEHKAAFLSVLS